jgi:DNA-binding winged helix-turn-helix (wHTH) protein
VEDAVHSPRVRFGIFEVDLQAGELRKAGLKLKLTGQPFQVLAILLERPGGVVTRDELQKRLWPDTLVDVDHNLNTAINKIREVLGDSAESPRFVETLPRRGYRFIAPLEGSGEAKTADGPQVTSKKFEDSALLRCSHRTGVADRGVVCHLQEIAISCGLATASAHSAQF